VSESRPFTLAHYRVTAAIGAGCMGEVYRATDTTLGREVAIKVLPSEVARDPERLARFAREARQLASLNHPNIAHVYGDADRRCAVQSVAPTLEPGVKQTWRYSDAQMCCCRACSCAGAARAAGDGR
jgi:hypothetical protein